VSEALEAPYVASPVHVLHNEGTITFIELCAGAGGMSSGFMKAGMKPLLLNDLMKDCCETLKLNHPGCDVRCGSFLDIDFAPFVGKVDVLAAGCPCQSFSTAGDRKGLEDQRGNLMLQYINIAMNIKPKIILIENVMGLLNHEGGETFNTVKMLLTETGEYDFNFKVLNANDHGVCQSRKRVFIICVRKDLNEGFNYPQPLAFKPVLRDILGNVPESPAATFSEKKRMFLSHIEPGRQWNSLPEDIKKDFMGDAYGTGASKREKLRKLSMNEPSLTVLCSPHALCHPEELRPFTVREYARIQSFPDSYQFHGAVGSQYKQIGNAVPVELAYHIGLSITETLLRTSNKADKDETNLLH
jgi:DNA (cytosine-5)-methyltransferase 1